MSLPFAAPFTVLDGGLSTVLEELGEHPSGSLWTASALAHDPELLVAAHQRFVAAGAEVVISASYQASVSGLMASGATEREARRLMALTTSLVRQAGASTVAASVGPYGALLADGSEYHGRYTVTWDEVRAEHRQRIELLAETDADVMAVETMPSAAEAALVAAEVRRCTDRPMWVSFTCVDGEHTVAGDHIADATVAVLRAAGGAVDAIGVNCTAPEFVGPLLRAIAAAAPGLPLVAYPNHGAEWDAHTKNWNGGAGAEAAAAHVEEWVAAGARLIGGCCGVGSDGIRAIAARRASFT